MDPDVIINMDQTPIPHSFHSNCTLDMKGSNMIHMQMSTTDIEHAPIVATITARGKLLMSFLIFIGKAD